MSVRLDDLASELAAQRTGNGAGRLHPDDRRAIAGTPDDPPIEVEPRPVLGSAAYHGTAGEYLKCVAAHTEACPEAILANVLVGAGNMIGRGPHVPVGPTRHSCNEYAVIVGQTGAARKSEAANAAMAVLGEGDPRWRRTRVRDSISSGEGVVHAVRDAAPEDAGPGADASSARRDTVSRDPGEPDKRLMLHMPELSFAFKVMNREGSTLSPVLRNAWDTDFLSLTSRSASLRATGAHVSLIGSITPREFLKLFSVTEAVNGFGNRCLYFYAYRARVLPSPEPIPNVDLQLFARELGASVAFAKTVGPVRRDPDAEDLWRAVYPELSAARPGVTGEMCARGAAHVVRLSLLYALLDRRATIGVEHLEAALAIEEYSSEVVRFVFGERFGDPVADKIVAALRRERGGLTRSELSSRVFSNNKPAAVIGQTLVDLARQGIITSHMETTGGRPRQRWRLATSDGERTT